MKQQIYCKNCGVELENDMLVCPLCGQPVNETSPLPGEDQHGAQKQSFVYDTSKLSKPQKKITWEIVSLILLSAIIATFIVDFIINKKITWSEYPMAISFIIFSYVSMFAFWDQKTLIQMAGGFIVSSILLAALDLLTGGISWEIKLAIPLLFTGNLIASALIGVIRKSKHKGINLIAYMFFAAALQTICIETILSFFKTGSFQLDWSVIVTASIVPVALLLLFLHFRLEKGRSLEKTFHV